MTDTTWQSLVDGCPPPWADGWGQDAYGFFVEIWHKKVVQKMRWIPPGHFMMGSPKNELERHDDEGPQYQVTIAKGFWLFDTACTQALWLAVMGDNPSAFQLSPNHPVEKVDFDQVQKFLQQINQEKPGLNLILPSEAWWEYACRAGSTTPFSFGHTITTQQVNFDGNYPYANGPKGEYRQQTVPVASLPANAWGLFEMHGNVWEWCEDQWHDSYEGAPTDGRAWVEDVAGLVRVIRGGSWGGDARDVRAAYRSGGSRSDRDRSLGFRCARVHS